MTRDGQALELDNIHTDPLLGFRMDPMDIINNFDDAIATWHTHPGADPNLSEEDYAGFMQWPNLEHWIVGTRDGEPTVVKYIVDDGVVVMICG